MKNDADSVFVQSLLQECGFQADLITPLPDNETPDIKVAMPEGIMLIEVKSKEDDTNFRNFLKSPIGTQLTYNTPARTPLEKASSQIHNYPDRKDTDFTLIWFITHKPGGITVLTASEVVSLLYGIEHIEGYMKEEQKFYEKDCFFFGESIFFSNKYLDGVVMHDLHPPVSLFKSKVQPFKLCLNNYSHRYNSFKRTGFVELFKSQFDVIDPPEMEAMNKCFIADCSVDRKNVDGVADSLKKKYSLDTVRLVRYILYSNPIK